MRTGQDLVIPVIEEELRVGKREVDAGGVRVTTQIRSLPIEKSVTVREESVKVERRVTNRPIDGADEWFRDRALEMKATSEEPVISKHAHVIEEIRVHKDRTERVETIHDSLRHTDVKVTEASPAKPSIKRQLSPAFEYGQLLHRRMPGRDFAALEADAMAKWEAANPGTWGDCKDAIRAGWESMS